MKKAVTNARNHSEATQVVVKLEFEPDRVVLSVTDNGRGFDQKSAHYGLGWHWDIRDERTGQLDWQ
jgi:signal transduction histidine kinase